MATGGEDRRNPEHGPAEKVQGASREVSVGADKENVREGRSGGEEVDHGPVNPALRLSQVDHALRLSNLAVESFTRYKRTQDVADLNTSIRYRQDVLALHPPGHPDRARTLGNLASGISTRYERNGDIADLEMVIQYRQDLLALRPPGHPARARSLANLASSFATRYERTGDIADLDMVIRYEQDALALYPSDHPDIADTLENLASGFSTRYEWRKDVADLDIAIRYLQDVLALHPPGHLDRADSLRKLAVALSTRYERKGDVADLDAAKGYEQEVLALHPSGHPERATSLKYLAASLTTRSKRTADVADLDTAIQYQQDVLALHPPGHPDRADSLGDLAISIFTRYKLLEVSTDLNTAIQHEEDALLLHPAGHPDRAHSLVNLAASLSTRYERTGDFADLETAIRYQQEVLALQPPGHPGRADSLGNLAVSIGARYKLSGDIADLSAAIQYKEEALVLRSSDHPAHASALGSLAIGLRTRYEQNGDIADIDMAIRYEQDVLALHPPGHADHAESLQSLAVSLSARYERKGDVGDLDTAIGYAQNVLALRPPGHPDRARILGNLAASLVARYDRTGGVVDLDTAIQYERDMLALCPVGHPDHAYSLESLAASLATRSKRTGDVADLNTAIRYEQDVLALRPPGHPDRADSLGNLAVSLWERSKQSGDIGNHGAEDHFATIISMLQEACRKPNTAFSSRLFWVIKWVSIARTAGHPSLAEAYTIGMELLNMSVTVARSLASQHAEFTMTGPGSQQTRTLTADAAAWALHQRQPQTAVEILDQGRGVLFAELGRYRAPLDTLPDKTLAARFVELSSQIEGSLVSRPKVGMMRDSRVQAPFVDEVAIHQRRLREWHETVALIRSTRGFEDFLKPTTFSNLAEAAAEGPVIVVNISRYRSDAIIIHQGGDPEVIELPLATPKRIKRTSLRLQKAVNDERLNAGVKATESEIREVLHTLWRSIAGPVVKRLRKMGVERGSRIWWCPTTTLCSMPLHAAGIYASDSKGRRLPDEYISSYTPTLSALISARRSRQPALATCKMLAVGVAKPDQREATEGQLENVSKELDVIGKRTPRVTRLEDQGATHDAVLEQLPKHTWIHFACHGQQDIKNPFDSRLSLQDKPLTLLEIIQARLPNAELAFLSACHSAKGDSTAPDEALHLAAALQFVGFRSVVGSLWAMDDRDGPDVAAAFYKHMLDEEGRPVDFRGAAKGVYHIATALRRKKVPLQRWINFVHVGA